MRNITQFLLMFTLSFYIAFAPAVANANIYDDNYLKDLTIKFNKESGERLWQHNIQKSVGAGVEIGVSQSYPVTATTTATTAAGATTTNTATLTAEKIGSKIFTPTTANIAKRFAGGVATGMVAMALYDLLGKSVDYVMDPANNRVTYKDTPTDGKYWVWSGTPVHQYPTYADVSPALACQKIAPLYNVTYHHYQLKSPTFAECYSDSRYYNAVEAVNYQPIDKSVSFDTLAQRSIDIANNPAHKDVATAQSGMQTVVGDMITKNEIDNSYFNDSSISNDTYNDVTNNYVTNNITNQYSSVSVPSQSEMAQAAANGQSSVTKTTQNANGTTTTTTTNFNTTNNTTTNNNTYNITNITVNNPVAQKDDSPASAPASTTTPTASTPASSTTPTKPFELPAFCDWAKPVCDFIEWFKKGPEKEDPQQPGVVPIPTPTDTVDISFSGGCPAPKVVPWFFAGRNIDITIPYTSMCDTATLLNPIIKLVASLGAVFIVAGIRRGDDG